MRFSIRAYQTLALVFQELVTNAAKFGALSTSDGTLTISWSFDPLGALDVTWTEQGGPAVQEPVRRGFGAVVVEQTVPFELHGEARVEYRPDGVWARFVIPPPHAKPGEADQPAFKPVESVATEWLRGKRLLLVEDSLMVALDAQASLQDAGVEVDIAGHTPDALRRLGLIHFDVAVLDINLSGETSFGIADACVPHQIPFVVATGYGAIVVMPERFRTIPVVSKLYDAYALQAGLERIAGRDAPH